MRNLGLQRRDSFFPSARAAIRRKRKPPRPRSTSESRARLSLVLLLYILAMILVITLAPFRFAMPARVEIETLGSLFETVTTTLLFVAVGFLYPLTRHGARASASGGAVLGVALGLAIQAARWFEADQAPALSGIAAAAIGAAIGATLLHGVNRRLRHNAQLSGRLSLEIPLMGLVYLLVPLVQAASFAAVGDPLRMVALVPLGLLGSRLFSALYEFHFGPAKVVTPRGMGVVAAVWMVLGAFPVIWRNPPVGVALVLLVALATVYESSLPAVHGAKDRRFEADVLRAARPYIAAYFIAAIVLPLASGVGEWRAAVGLTGADGDQTEQMMRLLEPLTSLAVLGYMIAEARGRRELPFRKSMPRVMAECACVALVIEASRGFQRDAGASAMQLGLTLAASIVGAGIYHSQRERVRWILIHRLR